MSEQRLMIDASPDVAVERLRVALAASTTIRGTVTGHQVALRSTVPVPMLGLRVDPPGRPVLRGHVKELDSDPRQAGLAGHLDTPTLEPRILVVLGGVAIFAFGISPVLEALSRHVYDPVNLALLSASVVFLVGTVWIFRLRSFVTRGDRAVILAFLDEAGIRFDDTATPPEAR